MKITSIQSRLYAVIVFMVLITSFVVLNYYLNGLHHSIDLEYQGITECDQKFSDIIFHEQTALNDPSQFAGLSGKYAVLERMCAKCHSGAVGFLIERETAFNKLFEISKETKKTYSDVHKVLLNLTAGVKYIHEHHIAYLKNLFRRKAPKQDYDTGDAFERSPVKSATEPDIIKVAVSIQSNLASVNDIFYRMQRDEDLKEVERAFSEKIKRFFWDVNTFENYSLDAQDGMLVEELLQSGRQFEKLFRYLLTAEQEKMNLMVQLKRNRARLLETLDMARSSIKSKHDRISEQYELIQFVTLLFSILLAGWVVFTGKQIIGQVKKGVAETNNMKKDLSYRVEIDNSIPDEFKIGYEALNEMARNISDQIKKLDAAYVELAQTNTSLRTEIADRKQVEEALSSEKQRIAYILQGTNVGTWEWNVQTGETTFNERWAEIVGCTLEEISPVSIDTWMKYTHPDDLKISGELLKEHVNGELDYYECEARMRHKNGDWIWVLTRGKVATWTEDGKPLLMSGTHLDITDRKQAEKEIAASLKEKEVLLREIHHRTKNNMQVMISLLKIQAANIEDKQVAEMFKESRDRIRSMALVHEKLYRSKGLADVDFKGYVKSLVSSIFSSYGARAAGITPIAETDDVSIGLETAIPCGLIINELVSNSLKYAFPGNRKGEIRVALRSFDEDALVLEVGDNGIGMPEDLDFRNTASMGLHLVQILSEGQLHGKIELDRAGGTTFRIRFKNHKYEARI